MNASGLDPDLSGMVGLIPTVLTMSDLEETVEDSEPQLPDNIKDTINELFEDYVFERMLRGKKRVSRDERGCGCNSCYNEAVRTYEWAYPEVSEYLPFDEIPDFMFVKESRDAYRESHGYGGLDWV